MLHLAILGLLADDNLHGYEIRRRLGQILGPIGRLSFGTLYPALNRLERDGAVAVLGVTQSRTGLTTTRGRKVYQITPQGRALFEELLTMPSLESDKEFTLRLTFARHLSREARVRLLSRRRDVLVDRIAEEHETRRDQEHDLDHYGESILSHRIEILKTDVRWLETLIAKETSPN